MPTRSQRILKSLGAIIQDAAYPTRCCGCGRLYRRQNPVEAITQDHLQAESGFDTELNEFLCSGCIQQIDRVQSPICTLCGRPFDSPHGVDHLCGRCAREPFEFFMARSVGLYAHALKDLICIYKYQFRSELGAPLGRLLWQTLQRYWDLEEIDGIIPVPLHRRRLRERGFNQAELMVRPWPDLARRRGLPFRKEKMLLDVMIRRRYTSSQTGLDKHQRAANLRHAFQLTDSGAVQGRRILLVDDVFTTGATANACAKVLRRAQAVVIGVLTLAHAA
jgi:ComF family protein